MLSKDFFRFNVFKFINVPVFIVSLAIGIFMVYVTIPSTRTIYVYPTPDNVDILQYRDRTDNCFELNETEVKCPQNEKDIAQIPVQA